MASLALRQVADAVADPPPAEEDTPACSTSNDYDGRLGIRISAIFVIFVGSFFGMVESDMLQWTLLTVSEVLSFPCTQTVTRGLGFRHGRSS